MNLLVVQLDGAEGSGTEVAGLKFAAVGRLFAVSIQVFPQINEVLTAEKKPQRKGFRLGDRPQKSEIHQ